MSMKRKNHIYIKATNYFENGEIDKAISKCEEGIAEDLKNTSVLNLKGLLLYLKGDLQGAIATWKINSDYNDDATAKNYLRDAKKDFERLELYDRSQMLLKNMRIEQAINLLGKCTESDFNSIKVNIALAMCYVKKGDYDLGSVYLTNVFKLDKNNKLAIEISKQLRQYGGIKLEVNKKNNHLKFLLVLLFIVIIGAAGLFIFTSDNDKNEGKNTNVISEKEDDKNKEVEDKFDKEDDKNKEEEIGEANNDALVNIEEINAAISNNNYNLIYDLVKDINKDNLSDEEKVIYLKAEEKISSDETIDYFYYEGLNYYNDENYEASKQSFIKVYTYGKNNYLYPHSIYFLGITNQKIGNNLESIKYYEQYFNEYELGIYIEEVIYSLAILYKDIDLNKTKEYGTYLINNYFNSIYNNDTLNNLLKQIQ